MSSVCKVVHPRDPTIGAITLSLLWSLSLSLLVLLSLPGRDTLHADVDSSVRRRPDVLWSNMLGMQKELRSPLPPRIPLTSPVSAPPPARTAAATCARQEHWSNSGQQAQRQSQQQLGTQHTPQCQRRQKGHFRTFTSSDESSLPFPNFEG